MKYINIAIMFLTFSFSQIQYAGTPIYKPENVDINFITVDHYNLIEHDLHPMVLHYANEYSVDIDVPKVATKVVDQFKTTFYLGVESEAAQAIAFHFNEFQLTKNSQFYQQN